MISVKTLKEMLKDMLDQLDYYGDDEQVFTFSRHPYEGVILEVNGEYIDCTCIQVEDE